MRGGGRKMGVHVRSLKAGTAATTGWCAPKHSAANGTTLVGSPIVERFPCRFSWTAPGTEVRRQLQPSLGDPGIRTTTRERSRTYDRTG